MSSMDALGVGVPTWGRVGGGFDVWLPLYVALAMLMVLAVFGWKLTARRMLAAVGAGMAWSWSVNVLGVIPAAATAVLVAVTAGILRRRPRSPGAGERGSVR